MINTAFNIHNSVLGKTGVREWRLDYNGTVPLSGMFSEDFGVTLKTNVDRSVLGQACVGDRVEVFTDGHSTGVFFTIIGGNQDYCTCVTCGRNEEIFVVSDDVKLGTMSLEKKFNDYDGIVSSVCIVPLGVTTVNTRINFTVDGVDYGNVTVNAGTDAGVQIVHPVVVNSGVLGIARNAVTNDSTPCAVYVVGQKRDVLLNVPLASGEKSRSVLVSDIGNVDVIVKFADFVRIKRVAVIPVGQNTAQVDMTLYSLANAAIAGGALTLPNASPVNIPVYGALVNYVTKQIRFLAPVAAVSPTKAKIVFVYEEVGSVVEYQHNIPNTNLATSPYTIPDMFDATAAKGLFFATASGNAWVKGNFRITLTNGANNMAANVDCADVTISSALANNVLIPANRLTITNVATGGSANPATVRVSLILA